VNDGSTLVKLVCGVPGGRGGIFARILRAEYGPTLTYQPTKASDQTFRSQGGQLLGRWALGHKARLGHLDEAMRSRSIALREPRRYGPGEHSDPVEERTHGSVEAWCDHCRQYHQLDLSALYSASRNGGSTPGVLVVGETMS
jgi:hypothetical protein